MSRRTAPAPRQPLTLAVPATLAVVLLAVPLAGIVMRAPWGELPARLSSSQVSQALGLSFVVSGWALLLSLLFGVPLAWLLARTNVPGKGVIRSLVLLPMVLPPTVAGVALLQGFGRSGLLGGALDAVGISLPFTTTAAILAATFVSLPFLVITLEGALAGLDVHFEEAAATMGADPLQTLRYVTLPLVLPSLIAGAALTWARALGEFGATLTFAGNLPGVTQTLPLQVYLLLQEDPAGATAVSLLLLAIAAAVLVILRGRWLRRCPQGGVHPGGVAAAREHREPLHGAGKKKRGEKSGVMVDEPPWDGRF
jgi:molybdate transport system permease protein